MDTKHKLLSRVTFKASRVVEAVTEAVTDRRIRTRQRMPRVTVVVEVEVDSPISPAFQDNFPTFSVVPGTEKGKAPKMCLPCLLPTPRHMHLPSHHTAMGCIGLFHQSPV